MNRLGPLGNGDNSRSYDGVLALTGRVQTVDVKCWVDPARPPKGVPTWKHGGSANLAYRDGKLVALGSGLLKVFCAESLSVTQEFPTVVTGGFQGWDRTNGNEKRTQAGHSVPAGLSTLYWLESDLVSVRPGGDVGSRPNGHDFVRVTGDAKVPALPRESNQREWLAACDGNPLVLYSLGGHAYGRMTIGFFSGDSVGSIRVPNAINSPANLSTPEFHYLLAPGKVVTQARNGGLIEHQPGMSIHRVDQGGGDTEVFNDPTMDVATGWDGTYAPQPWCLRNGKLYVYTANSRTFGLAVIDAEKWSVTRTSTPSMGYRPRVAVNRAGDVIVCGANTVCVPGLWTITTPLDVEAQTTNKQYGNHVVIDDAAVHIVRLIGGILVVESRSLKDGKPIGSHRVTIPGSDYTGQCHDAFAVDGAIYALVTAAEPWRTGPKAFTQTIVRVS